MARTDATKNSRSYVRDYRSPVPASKVTSKMMSANKGKDSTPEVSVRRALWSRGVRGYRIHWKIAGKPDLAFPAKSLAIFVHGCFWHRCPKCALPNPKTNSDFWSAKFAANRRRDVQAKLNLEQAGWKVMIFWECEIRKNVMKEVDKIYKVLKAVGKS